MEPGPRGLATLCPVTIAAAPGELPAVFTHAQARTHGISNRQLYAWRDAGLVDVVARGIYAQAGVDADSPVDFDLAEIAVRAPDATICLTSALARHGLVDDLPASIDVALRRSQRQPRTAAPVTWHRFGEATFGLGRQLLSVAPGVDIGLYDPARSIIDSFRLRHLHGQEQAVEALRRWLRRPGSQPSALLALARHFPSAEPPLRRTLEILL